MIKSGSLVYPVPPKVTSIALIVYEFIKETLGGTNASGLRVLSEEYSKPGSIILTLPILLIFLDTGKISAFIPCVDPILTKCGNWLYPNPPKFNLRLSTPPISVGEVVVYFKFSVSVCVYESTSGTSGNETLNVVDPTPNIEYFPV